MLWSEIDNMKDMFNKKSKEGHKLKLVSFKKKITLLFRKFFPRLSKQLFFDFMVKKKGLIQRINDINLLVLGSSHAKCGFNCNLIQNSFNLGTDNQDLYTSYVLLKSYISNMKNLRTVVLFYSLFSSGLELGKTTCDKDICLHHYIFDVPYSSACIPKYKGAYKHRLKKFNDSMINYENFSGYIPSDVIEEQNVDAVYDRVYHHMRENKRKPSQNTYLDQIYKLCEDCNVQLKIVIAPLRKDFIDILRFQNYSIDDLFKDVYLWAQKRKILIKNYLASSDFENSDFKDCDHLNASGASKLTALIIQQLL